MASIRPRTAYLYLVIATLFWGGHYVVGKYMMGSLTPMTALFLRSVVALVVVLVGGYFYLRQYHRLMWENRWILFWLGATGTFAFTAFSYMALSHTTAVNTGLMLTFCPAVVAVIMHFMNIEKLTLRTLFYCLLSILGVAIILLKGDFNTLLNHSYNVGELWAILPPLMWAVYSVLLRYVPDGLHSVTILQSQGIVATVLSGAAMLLVDGWVITEIDYTLEITGIIFYLVFLSFLGAYYCYNAATRVLGGFIGSLFVNGIPLIASIFGVILLGEILAVYHFVGAGLLFFGVYQLTIKKQLENKKT